MNHHLPAVLFKLSLETGETDPFRSHRPLEIDAKQSKWAPWLELQPSGLQPFKRAAEKQFFIQLYLKTCVFEMRCPLQVLWGCKKPRQKFSLSNFSPGYLASTWGALFSCVRVWKRPQKDTPKTCLSNFILWLRDNMPFSPLVRDVSSDI